MRPDLSHLHDGDTTPELLESKRLAGSVTGPPSSNPSTFPFLTLFLNSAAWIGLILGTWFDSWYVHVHTCVFAPAVLLYIPLSKLVNCVSFTSIIQWHVCYVLLMVLFTVLCWNEVFTSVDAGIFHQCCSSMTYMYIPRPAAYYQRFFSGQFVRHALHLIFFLSLGFMLCNLSYHGHLSLSCAECTISCNCSISCKEQVSQGVLWDEKALHVLTLVLNTVFEFPFRFSKFLYEYFESLFRKISTWKMACKCMVDVYNPHYLVLCFFPFSNCVVSDEDWRKQPRQIHECNFDSCKNDGCASTCTVVQNFTSKKCLCTYFCNIYGFTLRLFLENLQEKIVWSCMRPDSQTVQRWCWNVEVQRVIIGCQKLKLSTNLTRKPGSGSDTHPHQEKIHMKCHVLTLVHTFSSCPAIWHDDLHFSCGRQRLSEHTPRKKSLHRARETVTCDVRNQE